MGLNPSRLEYWMDLNNVFISYSLGFTLLFVENVDRPLPLLYILNGGEVNAKLMRK